MAAIDTDAYRKRLLERREALQGVEGSGDDASKTVELDQTRFGRLSRMDALQQQAMAKATRRRRAEEIKRIGAALARIEADEFGLCVECGEPIQPGRLDHDPAVALCIDCAEDAEG